MVLVHGCFGHVSVSEEGAYPVNTMEKLDCLLINLDRSPERLAQMSERLARLDLPFRRIAAIDGAKVTFTDREINAAEYARCHGKYATPTEVACYVSHYHALQDFCQGDKEYALILEDDMEFSDDLPLVMEALMQSPEDWDMVKLNGLNNWAGPIVKKRLFKDYKMVFNLLHQAKAGAYLVNRCAAKSYLQSLLPMTVPYDHEFLKFWKYDITILTILPFPAWECGVSSTINYEMVNKNRKKWYNRLDCYAYRAKIALQRLWYGIKRDK